MKNIENLISPKHLNQPSFIKMIECFKNNRIKIKHTKNNNEKY